MHYGDETSTSISTYYFEAKSRDEDNYKAIVIIFAVSIMLPIATSIAFSYIVFGHSDWIADYTTTYVKGNYKQESPKKIEATAGTVSNSKEKTTEETIELSSFKVSNCASGSDSLLKDQKIDTANEETPNI